MLELVYNGFLFFMLAMWLLGMFKLGVPKRFSDWARRHNRFVPAVLWAVFLSFLIGYLLFFSQLNHDHDIPEAVSAAVSGLDRGLNPYIDPVVPRFEARDHIGFSMGLGTYNYLPLDLLVYSGMHHLLGFLGFPVWFVLSNIVFSTIAIGLFRELAPVKWPSYLPIGGMVILYYSFDNCSLTILLMVLSVYALRRLGSRYSVPLSIFLMGLAVMTKVYAAIPFAVLVLWLIQEKLSERRPVEVAKVLGGLGAAAGAGALFVLPFGLGNVFDSAVFFHLTASSRYGTMSGGTLLAEAAMNNPYYAYIAVGAVVAALVASMRLRDLNDRIALVSLVFLMVVVKSSLSLVTVPGIFLGIRLYELTHRIHDEADEPRPSTAPAKVALPKGEEAG